MIRRLATVALAALACSCSPEPAPDPAPSAPVAAGESAEGVRRIPVETSRGTFEVWTKRVGENPRIKVLLLHGGPGMTHEYLENFAEFLPPKGIEIYFYDQLGSYASDRPENADDLWEIPRFVDEVEQVRTALGLGPDNFYLYGSSWGGILAMEYALAYPEALKGMIVSNMMASIPAYNTYANDVLMASMDPTVLAEIRALEDAEDYENPRYMELLMEHHYVDHLLRRPANEWPDAVTRTMEHVNPEIYISMQGPSELGATGKLENWDRTADLASIEVPTLVIGAAHDTMDPAHMEWMAGAFPNGRYLFCPDGSHLTMWDDTDRYFEGMIAFLRDVDAGAGD